MYSTMPFLYLPLIIMVQWNMTLWSLQNKNTIVLEGPWGHEGPMFHRAMIIERVVACSSNVLTWNHHLHTPNAAPHTFWINLIWVHILLILLQCSPLLPGARHQQSLRGIFVNRMDWRIALTWVWHSGSRWVASSDFTNSNEQLLQGLVASGRLRLSRSCTQGLERMTDDRTLCSGSAGKICKTHWPAKRSKG